MGDCVGGEEGACEGGGEGIGCVGGGIGELPKNGIRLLLLGLGGMFPGCWFKSALAIIPIKFIAASDLLPCMPGLDTVRKSDKTQYIHLERWWLWLSSI